MLLFSHKGAEEREEKNHTSSRMKANRMQIQHCHAIQSQIIIHRFNRTEYFSYTAVATNAANVDIVHQNIRQFYALAMRKMRLIKSVEWTHFFYLFFHSLTYGFYIDDSLLSNAKFGRVASNGNECIQIEKILENNHVSNVGKYKEFEIEFVKNSRNFK